MDPIKLVKTALNGLRGKQCVYIYMTLLLTDKTMARTYSELVSDVTGITKNVIENNKYFAKP